MHDRPVELAALSSIAAHVPGYEALNESIITVGIAIGLVSRPFSSMIVGFKRFVARMSLACSVALVSVQSAHIIVLNRFSMSTGCTLNVECASQLIPRDILTRS